MKVYDGMVESTNGDYEGVWSYEVVYPSLHGTVVSHTEH